MLKLSCEDSLSAGMSVLQSQGLGCGVLASGSLCRSTIAHRGQRQQQQQRRWPLLRSTKPRCKATSLTCVCLPVCACGRGAL